MKFMKVGSKPDTFQTEGDNVRYVANELATDVVVSVEGAKFYLHKFPLLSKCSRLQNLLSDVNHNNSDEVNVSDIPGGSAAFEICAKFCYSMAVTLNAYNVVAARCAAEYLGMHETVEKGNLIYKIDVFLNSSIFRSWKDSIIVLQTTKAFLPLSEDLKLVSHCIDAITKKASVDVSKVDWSYTYNRKKLSEENGIELDQNGIRTRSVPRDWWVEDLSELDVNYFKRTIVNIKNKGLLADEVIGEALKAFAYRRLSGFNKGTVECRDVVKYRSIVDTIVWLLPSEKSAVSCSFLIKLLKSAISVDSGNMVKEQLVKRIGWQLEEASVNDLLIRLPDGEETLYDVDTVIKIVGEFLMRDQTAEIDSGEDIYDVVEVRKPGILSEASKLMVAKLIDGYLAEIAKDKNLPVSKFVGLAEMLSSVPRPAHDALYRAIDMYLKEHPDIDKNEKKRTCKLMDCRKLSADACMHAVQNERLPLRVVVQVLFFEQVRASAASGSTTPDLPKGFKDLKSGSHGSSRSAVTTKGEDDWDPEELKALRSEIAALRLKNGEGKNSVDKAAFGRVKRLLKSKKMFRKLLSGRRGGGGGENSGSDSSESLGSVNPEEAKSTPSRNRRHSVS